MNSKNMKYNLRHGQALLILVLVIALAITVVSAVSFKLTTETQSTKSQEENVRILAAADSGIEEGLRLANQPSTPSDYYGTYLAVGNGLQNLPGVDSTRSTLTITDTSGNVFVTPELPPNEQYTFYLWNYPATTSPIYYDGAVMVYFASNGAGSCNATRTAPAIEVTVIYGTNGDSVQRYLFEPCTTGQYIGGTGKQTVLGSGTLNYESTDYAFNWRTIAMNMAIFPEPRLLIIRSLFGGTRLGFQGDQTFPEQGKLIRSEAVSNSGSSKVVTLFQSHPQIPADFFVTTF